MRSGKKKLDASNYKEAVDDFTTVINANQAKTDKYIKDKERYENLTEYEKQVAESGQLLQPDSNLSKPYYYRGMCEESTGKKEEAMKDFDMAAKLNNRFAEPHLEMAKMKFADGKKDEGCMEMRAAADLGNKDAKDAYENNFCWSNSINYYKKGVDELYSRNYEAALVDLNLAVKLSPDSSQNYVKRGMAFYGLGKFDKATLDFSKAVELNPNNAEAYFQRGMSCYSTEKWQLAFDNFTKALQINTNYTDAYLYRAYSSEQMTNFNSALYDYQQLMRLKPDFCTSYYKAALIKNGMGLSSDACKWFKKAALLGCEEAADYANDKSCK